MPKYTESDIENGIEFVLAGRSLRYAAEASGVPRQTSVASNAINAIRALR
jgi:hypothetical protein